MPGSTIGPASRRAQRLTTSVRGRHCCPGVVEWMAEREISDRRLTRRSRRFRSVARPEGCHFTVLARSVLRSATVARKQFRAGKPDQGVVRARSTAGALRATSEPIATPSQPDGVGPEPGTLSDGRRARSVVQVRPRDGTGETSANGERQRPARRGTASGPTVHRCWSGRWIPVGEHGEHSRAVGFMTDRVLGWPHNVERWAAEQVLRQHENGGCKQCAEPACPMLAWAHGVLGGGPVGYPTVEPSGHTL